MPREPNLVNYYDARAREYEKVYDKPERQSDLRIMHEVIPAFFAGRHVLEIACGTGYWTRRIALRAASIVAVDAAPSTLEFARAHQPNDANVDFRVGDAFDLASIGGSVDAAFAGFWWSHVRREDVHRFLIGLHQRMPAGSPVLFVDNRFVAGSNQPITREDAGGNTYQRRRLESGAEHEVLKNFPTKDEIRSTIVAAGGSEPTIEELTYYWYASYFVADMGGPA
jgi:demethylmenaquinone methyltransferase/2-methoxy-6-polyprenyl-1,4-benzoquinol methylase